MAEATEEDCGGTGLGITWVGIIWVGIPWIGITEVGLVRTGITGVGAFTSEDFFDNSVEGCSAGNCGIGCVGDIGFTGGIIGDV